MYVPCVGKGPKCMGIALQYMYLEDYAKKQLFGSLDKNKLPANLTDYTCELVIQDYAQGRQSSQNSYFKFTPRPNTNAEPFIVEIDAVAPAKNLIMSYRIKEEGEEEGRFLLGERQEFKMQTSVKLAPKPASNLETIEQSEDEVYPDDDIEIRMIELGDEESEEESSSKCIEPSDGDKGRIKAELIQYLHFENNRTAKLKEIRAYLQEKGYRVAENRIKTLLAEICKVTDKKTGYILKDQFQNDGERKNPRKRIKDE